MPLASFRATSLPVLGRDQPREHLDAARVGSSSRESRRGTARRGTSRTRSRRRSRAVLRIELLQQDHAVGDALHLQVVIGRGHVVEQQHRALTRWRRTA